MNVRKFIELWLNHLESADQRFEVSKFNWHHTKTLLRRTEINADQTKPNLSTLQEIPASKISCIKILKLESLLYKQTEKNA